jgi:hypothetical protein
MAEKKWKNRTFSFQRLPADESVRFLARLVKVFGPAAGVMRAIAEPDETKRDELFMSAVGEFITKMDDKAVSDLVIEAASMCRVDGAQAIPGVMDLDEMFQAAFFVLQTEYGSFLAGNAGSFMTPQRPRGA